MMTLAELQEFDEREMIGVVFSKPPRWLDSVRVCKEALREIAEAVESWHHHARAARDAGGRGYNAGPGRAGALSAGVVMALRCGNLSQG
jgi:hypothetical protein